MVGGNPALIGAPRAARMPRLARSSPVLPSTLVPDFPDRRDWRRQGVVVFLGTLAIYLAVACWLALDVRYYLGDALSRTQAAESILYSRNPNLSVMGFIFTPLTTLAQLPLAAVAPLIPDLTRTGFAGAVVSAVFMAGACRQLWLIAAERDIPRWYAVAVVVMFAFHPMIVLYGTVGMSEAPFIFGVLWASRRLIRWTSTDDVHELITAGFALAVAFLARYDALVMAFVVMLFVGVMTRRVSPSWTCWSWCGPSAWRLRPGPVPAGYPPVNCWHSSPRSTVMRPSSGRRGVVRPASGRLSTPSPAPFSSPRCCRYSWSW